MVGLIAFGACGTSGEITALADLADCEKVRETGQIDMQGTGLAGLCEDLPEGGSALLLSFRDQEHRDRFFREVWPSSKFCGSSTLVGEDWSIAIDDGIEKTGALHERVGGTTLPEARTGFPGCD